GRALSPALPGAVRALSPRSAGGRSGPVSHRGDPQIARRRMTPGIDRTRTEAQMEPKEMFFDERDAIVATLRSLTPEQWDAPSLCEGWRVRDVAGHMITGLETSLPSVLTKTAKAGFSINKASAQAGRETGARPTDEL